MSGSEADAVKMTVLASAFSATDPVAEITEKLGASLTSETVIVKSSEYDFGIAASSEVVSVMVYEVLVSKSGDAFSVRTPVELHQ